MNALGRPRSESGEEAVGGLIVDTTVSWLLLFVTVNSLGAGVVDLSVSKLLGVRLLENFSAIGSGGRDGTGGMDSCTGEFEELFFFLDDFGLRPKNLLVLAEASDR